MRARYLFAAATTILLGCAGILGVPDLTYDPNAIAGGDGGGTGPDGSSSGGLDGGGDAASCVGADLQKDAKNCGRCGHDCGGGTCQSGVCQPFQLASVPGAPLEQIVATDTSVFVSTSISLAGETGGLWRIPKNGGTAELYADVRYARDMAIVGADLYFVSDDTKSGSAAGATGGFYKCPVTGAAPCTPQLIKATESPHALTSDNGKLYFPEDLGTTEPIWQYTPGGGAPTTFRTDATLSWRLAVLGDRTWSTFLLTNNPYSARLAENLPDGGFPILTQYDANHAQDSALVTIPGGLLFVAYDFQTETSGVVRRVPIDNSVSPCDYGGGNNKRPFGVHADKDRVYWTNQGDGANKPYTNGSVVSCPASGCCTAPDMQIWSNAQGMPRGITGDATAIYWVNYGNGQVWKSAKP